MYDPLRASMATSNDDIVTEFEVEAQSSLHDAVIQMWTGMSEVI